MRSPAVTALVAVLVAIPVICLTRRYLPLLLRGAGAVRAEDENRRYDTADCLM